MTRISVWKRVGGWLRRSHVPPSPGEAGGLDAEGMLMGAEPAEDEAPQRTLTLNKKDRQMAAMEDGFSRLVEVLESINDNVVQQRRQTAEQQERLAGLSDLARTMPEVIAASQQASKELSEQLRNQSLQNQQLTEVVKVLPGVTQRQVEKLAEISQQLESSAEADLRMAESFNRLDGSMTTVVDHSRAQAASCSNVTTGVSSRCSSGSADASCGFSSWCLR